MFNSGTDRRTEADPTSDGLVHASTADCTPNAGGEPTGSPAYHAQSVEAAIAALGSSATGLDQHDAQRRLREHGPNMLAERPRTPAWQRFLEQFNDPLIYVLLVTAAITALLHHYVDTGVILGVVVVNAIIGYLQEAKAEKAIDSIKRMLSPSAMALRGGVKTSVPASELVPGDVVLLYSGDKVPADMRLMQQKNMQIDEAPLTGESLPVEKVSDPLPFDTSIGDRRNLAFAGTLVTTGTGTGLVVATGSRTELGRIAGMLEEVEGVDTPLIRRLAQFSKFVTIAIVVFCVLVFVVGVATGIAAMDMLMAAVALAVSAIPEGLPAIMTIALAIGVKRMASRNAIVRKLPAVESLGSATVICTDKTGTLTRNEMTATRIITANKQRYAATGTGYIPEGSIYPLDNETAAGTIECQRDGAVPTTSLGEPPRWMHELLKCGTLCNDAQLSHEHDQWRMDGDPTEGSLLVLATKAGYDTAQWLLDCPRTDEIPFESERQYMATMHRDHHGHAVLNAKGAPEAILARCSRDCGTADEFDRERWHDTAAAMATEGLRVLAFAHKPLSPSAAAIQHEDLCDLQFLGLVGIMDPPRDEAIKAIRKCHAAGIQVKMITGDHAATARAIAQQIGLHNGNHVVTGKDVDNMSVDQVDQVVATTNVFARVSPAHKLLFVQSLQRQGNVVAMTGDGVNDAPALKQADIGIAMGVTGTEVSKEAAEMVLLDDNFASIERAVEEGRTVYNNLKKTILFILPTNGGECLTLVAALLLGIVLPILPLHILWINLVTTVALAITLAFDPADHDTMRRPPRHPSAPLIDGLLVWRIIYVSLLMALGTFGLFVYETTRGTGVEAARGVAVNAIVFFEVAYLLNTRHLTGAVLSRAALVGNPIVWCGISAVAVLQVGFTYLPLANRLFEVGPIDLGMWARILTAAVVLFVIVELEKAVARQWRTSSLGPEVTESHGATESRRGIEAS
ncbi:MAG: HAD-IC family P-type ATPase [Pirellulaceae bacterium]|nr:HAD-IC family P-type ATPase [Planctomycetales bacterium]